MIQSSGPLFVVSLWRAGSSLLYALLNKHPDVGLMYEADFPLLRPVFFKPDADWARRWEFLNAGLTRHGLTVEEFVGDAEFRAAFTASHQAYAERKGATIWGDKSPHYYDQLNFLAETFPEARFIIVWRDLFHTTSSIIRAGQSGSSYFRKKGMPLRALVGYEILKRECDSLLRKAIPVCQLNYEDLVSDPAGAMQQVCAFLQILYFPDLATIAGADRSATHPGEHHRLLRGNAIVSEPNPELLPQRLRQKIAGYHTRYQTRHGDWPAYPKTNLTTVAPSVWQVLADRIAYRVLRAWDGCGEWIFCLAPVRLLATYRRAKERVRTSAAPDTDIG